MGARLKIENVGPIKKADIRFGDLTVFVGPQATGKSVALQLLKLLVDIGHIQSELKRYGVDWGGQVPAFFDAYLGEGMRSLWREDMSRITWEGKAVKLRTLLGRQQRRKGESLFYVPAQRVLTLRNGWPRPFTDYSAGDPFVVRQFSERLRRLLEEGEFARTGQIFPQTYVRRRVYRDLLDETIFQSFALRIDKHLSQKRLVLDQNGGDDGLPFMVWSTGQREFIPLLLAFYWLMPPLDIRWRKWVVMEEPEMGLHTRAISAVLLMTLGLLQRGYKVCISTHSPYVLDVVWALNRLKRYRAPIDLVREIFDAPKERQINEIAKSALTKDSRVYHFDSASGKVKDISNLDPGATDEVEAGWGGLGEFSGRVADVVAKAVARGE
ncbi:MAG: ATP-binding protein [Planctomycetes bacterium]|nr:ATP-binding protein [Planctomycetota bacterium]